MKRIPLYLTIATIATLMLSGCGGGIHIPKGGPHDSPPPSSAPTPAPTAAPTEDPTPAPTTAPATFLQDGGCPTGFESAFIQRSNDTYGEPFFSDIMTAHDFFQGANVPPEGCFFSVMEYGQSEDGNPNWVGFIPGDFSLIQSLDSALVAAGFTDLSVDPPTQCSSLVRGRLNYTLKVWTGAPTGVEGRPEGAMAQFLTTYPYVSIHAEVNDAGIHNFLPLQGLCGE